LPSVGRPALQYLFALLHKRHELWGGTEHIMCVLISYKTLSETFLILRRNERGMIKNVY
jgi:hypothetical protein